jgi:pimeloyl-ACP methyl ester carboxylesterase
MLELSQVFDADYYSANNPDLAAAGLVNPDQLFNHFNQFGINEGRGFSPYVDLDFYGAINSDLGAAGLIDRRQLLDHLINFGINENRRFSPNVNLSFYGAVNPDLVAAGLDTGEELFDHLINFGAREGRLLVEPLAPEPVQPGPPELPDFPELPAFPTPQSLNFSGGNLLLGGQSNSGQSAPDLNVVLATGLQSAISQLQDFLTDPDFANKITTAFGEAVNLDAAKALIQELANAQSLPTIKMANLDELAGNQGAYDALTNTAYISQEFLLQYANNPENIASVLLEEIGHSIDSRINAVDAPGDEGSIFSQLVRGNNLSAEDLSKWKTEDDMTTLTIGDSNISVELSKQWDLWIYNWNNFRGWNNPDSSTVVSGSGNGINLNWGTDSADRFSQVYLGDLKDNFVAVAGTTAYFEAGKTYRFRANADDLLVLGAFPKSNPNNGTWITSPQWDRFDHTKGRPADKYYNFTPKETGSHTVYSYLREEYGNAYMDVSWEPGIAQANKKDTITKSDGATSSASLYRVDGGVSDIKDRPTWVVIHSMNGSPIGGSIQKLWQNIGNYKQNDQVLVLDWSNAADSGYNIYKTETRAPDPRRGGTWIMPIGKWAADKLSKEFRISPGNINLVGHSLGSFVAGEIAKNIPGGVNNLVALDPATTTGGAYPYEDSIDFSAKSKWSWGFYGSALGDPGRAKSAKESFEIKFPNTNPESAHGGVVEIFANMVKRGSSGYVSNYFQLDSMGSGKPWNRNSGFEATIETKKNESEGWIPYLLKHNNGSTSE